MTLLCPPQEGTEGNRGEEGTVRQVGRAWSSPAPTWRGKRAPRFRRLPRARLRGAGGRLGVIGDWVAASEGSEKVGRWRAVGAERQGRAWSSPAPTRRGKRGWRFRRLPRARLRVADGRSGGMGEWVAAFEGSGKVRRSGCRGREAGADVVKPRPYTERQEGLALSAFASSVATGCGWTIRGNFSRGSSRVIGARTTGTGGNSSRSSGAGWAGVLVEEVRRSDRRKNWRWR